MELVQSRIVTDDVERLAAWYAALIGVPIALNEYYVEVPAGQVSVGFSKRRFTEYRDRQTSRATGPPRGGPQRARPLPGGPLPGGPLPGGPSRRTDNILDFLVADVDTEHQRIAALGVDWVMHPTTQPWGNRAMILADPEGSLVNVFSRATDTAGHDTAGHDTTSHDTTG